MSHEKCTHLAAACGRLDAGHNVGLAVLLRETRGARGVRC